MKHLDLIFVGRLAREKRLDTLFKIAELAKKQGQMLTIGIVGEGNLKSWVVGQIKRKELTDSVQYFGYSDQPIALVKQARLLVLPSDYEALPMVVLEAASVGVPSLVANFKGAAEIIKHQQTGWIVRQRIDFPRVALKLLEQRARLTKMGLAAKRFVRAKYARKQNLHRFINVLVEETRRETNRESMHLVIPYWSLGLGGIETRLKDLLITIATSYPKICVTILLKRRQPWAVRIPPNPQIRFRYFSKNIETGRPIRFGWWCFKAMLDLEPDCILGFLNRFGLVAVAAKYWFALLKQRRVCALISQESLLSAYLTQHESWIFKYLARLVYRLASKVIVLTYATKEDLKKNFNVPTRKIIYLPGWLPQ